MLYSGFECTWQPPELRLIVHGSNTWFLGPTHVYASVGISIDSAVFAGLTNVTNGHTDRHTDHATPSVAGRILRNECVLCS